MSLKIRYKDQDVLKFSVAPASENFAISIEWITSKKALLPMGMAPDNKGISDWLAHRAISKNRAYANAIAAKFRKSLNRPIDILVANKGLSLDDNYNIVEDSSEAPYDELDLHHKAIDNRLAILALSGKTFKGLCAKPSPELTTQGNTPKCWIRKNGKLILLKSNSLGNEVFSEFYAGQIAEALGINAVKYGLNNHKGVLCSSCKSFTSSGVGFATIRQLLPKATFKDIAEYYTKNKTFKEAFKDMLILDALTLNTDRHVGNIGVLFDERNKIIGPAPIFDNGCSLLSRAPSSAFKNITTLEKYASKLVPRLYDDFIGVAKQYINNNDKERIASLGTFKFKKHPRYNLPANHLKLLEEIIHRQSEKLIGDIK
ncbi:MAG: hypothetical protein MJY82_01460 [Fibrobacter sp.]|nr:hypothetical protein [Fibrobacter sp.]